MTHCLLLEFYVGGTGRMAHWSRVSAALAKYPGAEDSVGTSGLQRKGIQRKENRSVALQWEQLSRVHRNPASS